MSRNRTRTLAALILTMAFALCAAGLAGAQDVTYNAMPGTDFSKFKTYKWVTIEGGEQLDQIADAQIKQAVDGQLAAKGLTKTDSASADLDVGYQVAVNQERQWNAYGGGGFRFGGGMGSATSSTISIGTLGVDIYDEAGKQLVWLASPAVSLAQQPAATGAAPVEDSTELAFHHRRAPAALWNQVWSFSGDPSRADVNQMFLQPFLSYQATRTVTLTLQSESSANWEVDEDRWSVPINVLFAKLSSFGVFPASYQIGFGAFAVHPDTGPSWKIRGGIVILLPRRK